MRVGKLEVRRLVTAMIAATTLVACSGGDDGTEPTPEINIALSSPTLSIVQGGNGTVTVTLTRSGGFTGDITIAVEGLPANVTAAPLTVASTATSGVLTLTAAATASAATTNLTVRATGSGVTAKTAPLALTVTAAPAQGYTLAVAPTATNIGQGSSGNLTVTLTRTGGFAGAVGLAVTGLPTGVTASFNPQSIPGTSSTATITLTAAANATVGGPTTVTVTSTATGQPDKTATVQLTITAVTAGGFTLAATTPVTVQQGGTGTSTVTITRTNGFAGAVTLTATGLPNGVTAAFNPAAPTTNTSTLTFTATGTATVGQATVTVRGNSGTLAEQTATVTLNVTAATGGSGNTTWEFCTTTQTPIWLAIQDGAAGTWTRVTPTGTKFQFNITQAKAGVAYVIGTTSASVGTASRTFASRLAADMRRELLLRNRPTRAGAYAASSLVDGFELNIFYGTQAELNAQGTTGCLPGAGKTVNGSVAGVGASQSATITLGTASADASGTTPTFQLKDVPDGALDLVAGRTTTTISGTDFSFALDKLIIRRGINAANNSTLPVLDFGAAEAFDPVQANITLGNLGTELGFALTSYFTAAGSSAGGATLAGFSMPGSGPFKYYGVPAARQIAGDLHLAIGFAVPTLTTEDQGRFAALFFKDPTDRTVTLGTALTAPTVSTAATAPYVRFRVTAAIQAAYNKVVEASFTQEGTAPRTVNIQASEGYLTGSANYDLTIPDFSGVGGWDNNWGPKVGAQTAWEVTAYGYTGIGFGSPNPVEGSTFSGATRSGTITP